MMWCGTPNFRLRPPSWWLPSWSGRAGPAEDCAHTNTAVIAGSIKLKNAEEPTNAAAEKARKYDEAAVKAAKGEEPRIKAAKALVAAHAAGVGLPASRLPIGKLRALLQISVL